MHSGRRTWHPSHTHSRPKYAKLVRAFGFHCTVRIKAVVTLRYCNRNYVTLRYVTVGPTLITVGPGGRHAILAIRTVRPCPSTPGHPPWLPSTPLGEASIAACLQASRARAAHRPLMCGTPLDAPCDGNDDRHLNRITPTSHAENWP